jgi:signal transduction histidine kinase
MLKRLRFQLTLLYILAALGLVVLLGVGSYSMLQIYLQNATDQALQYKMAIQFRQYGVGLPLELANAERQWSVGQKTALPAPTPATTNPVYSQNEEEEGDNEIQPVIQTTAPTGGQFQPSEELDEDAFNSQLAPIFVAPLDDAGKLIPGSARAAALVVNDAQASAAALASGYDLRTTRLAGGQRVRLLTYRTGIPGGPALLQVGRLLGDQDQVMEQFLRGLLILAAISMALLGLGSWFLSGRAIRPTQQAWENQRLFIANASHELRAPLTLIKADAEVGLRANPTGEDQQVLQDILHESDYMNRLVDDLLLLSRLDSQHLKLDHISIELKPLLEDIRRQMNILAIEKGQQITLQSTEGKVWGDPVRVRQTILILVDNAVRHSPPGSQVSIDTFRTERSWNIQVSDSGPGIPAKDLPHVFERFYQVQRPGNATDRSNGLGLSIAKALVEAQGGKIRITSEPGKGAQATISLPAA